MAASSNFQTKRKATRNQKNQENMTLLKEQNKSPGPDTKKDQWTTWIRIQNN